MNQITKFGVNHPLLNRKSQNYLDNSSFLLGRDLLCLPMSNESMKPCYLIVLNQKT
jgi:hypothetical protein